MQRKIILITKFMYRQFDYRNTDLHNKQLKILKIDYESPG